MITFEEFEKHLHAALVHLYDPLYQPPDFLYNLINPSAMAQFASTKAVTLVPQSEQTNQFQQAVIAVIDHLRPGPDVPDKARSRRMYELLASRYVQELTQEETAERLGITPRHLRREQQQAVLMLAQKLWNTQTREQARSSLSQAPSHIQPQMNRDMADVSLRGDEDAAIAEEAIENEQDLDAAWRMQVQQEVAALQQNDPNTVAEIAPMLEHVRQLEERLAASRGVSMTVQFVQEPVAVPLAARMHPSLLRQMVIIAVQKLLANMHEGQISCHAQRNGDVIELAIVGEPVASAHNVDSEFIRETLASLGGGLEIRRRGYQQGFHISIPYQAPVTVLVVDDNHDLVHFYRRYTERTRYAISHLGLGQQVFEQLAEINPDIVVLDVMLPDIDGWEVLTRCTKIRQHLPYRSSSAR